MARPVNIGEHGTLPTDETWQCSSRFGLRHRHVRSFGLVLCPRIHHPSFSPSSRQRTSLGNGGPSGGARVDDRSCRPHVSTPKRMLLLLGVILAGASATMARLNYFEWMFHHLRTPGFEEVAGSKLDSSEMVMAVRLGEDSRAYPIREMAYHHVVNDIVGGVPIAVTY
ncbi:MAG: hypothetical protein DMG71_10190 [Acidobacteria bacterium]|nr:MAG: hypothetical protein DMG71_10190 [Acidobacteriota bacterium]